MVEKEKIEIPPDASLREKGEPPPDERATRLTSLRADISNYRGSVTRADALANEPDLSFPGISLSSEATSALKLKMEEESSSIEGQRKAYEEKWKELLLGDEPLTFAEVKKFTQLERPGKWPSSARLAEFLAEMPRQAARDADAHRQEIVDQGGDPEKMIEKFRSFENAKGVEVKGLEELKHWDKIKPYLEKNNLASKEMKVVVVDNEEYWNAFFGSNPSKSVVEPKTIILKKEIFESENISDEDLSWIVHEVGHVSFYDFLDDKKDGYMDEVQKQQKYTDTAMESVAFGSQVDYLKSLGKTKQECLSFVRSYVDESSGSEDAMDDAQRASKQKELRDLAQYVEGVFGS
jgi:hypothetical protein